jgi:hypothetical protein
MRVPGFASPVAGEFDPDPRALVDPMLPVLAFNLKPQSRHRPAPRAGSGGGAACLAVFGVAAHQSVQAAPLMSAHSVQ